MKATDRARKGWARRKELYGPSGGNDGSGHVMAAPGLTCHNSHNTYLRHGCRCRWCSEAYQRHAQRWVTKMRRILGGENDAHVLPIDYDASVDDSFVAMMRASRPSSFGW